MENQQGKNFYVYELIDPRNGKVFYVGKGSKNGAGEDRIDVHTRRVKREDRIYKKNNPYLFSKIKKILSEGYDDIIKRKVKFFVYEKAAYNYEKKIIFQYGLKNLCNILEGGVGVGSGENNPRYGKVGYWKNKTHSKETKKKMSEQRTGENSNKSKLTWNIVREIRFIYANYDTVTFKLLSKKYNVTVSCIQHIIRNESWIDLNYQYARRENYIKYRDYYRSKNPNYENKVSVENKRKIANVNYKVNKEDREIVKKLYYNKIFSYKSLGKLFNVSSGTISNIINDKCGEYI